MYLCPKIYLISLLVCTDNNTYRIPPTGPCYFSVLTQVSNNELYIKCAYVYLNKGRLNNNRLNQPAGYVCLRCVLAERKASTRRVDIRKRRMNKLCFRCRWCMHIMGTDRLCAFKMKAASLTKVFLNACGSSTERTRKPEKFDVGLACAHVWVDVLSKNKLSMR